MRFAKPAVALLAAYVALVVAFEAYLGIAQPRFEDDPDDEWGATIVLSTTGDDGRTEDRNVTPMITDGRLYVSANHWPRSWYGRVLEHPDLEVANRGEKKGYHAVPVEAGSEEHERLEQEHPHPAWFRFLTGYPPRRFVRLDPR